MLVTCRRVEALSESRNTWLCAPSATATADILEKDERGARSDLLKTMMWIQRWRATADISAAFLRLQRWRQAAGRCAKKMLE